MTDLVERVARALDPEAFDAGWNDKIGWAKEDARAAIAVVLREILNLMNDSEDGDWDFLKFQLERTTHENGVSLHDR